MAAPEGDLHAALLESAGQGRLDHICTILAQVPDVLETRGNFGERCARAPSSAGSLPAPCVC